MRKIYSKGNTMKHMIFLLSAGLLCGAMVITGCANISQSNWCSNIPDDSYSVICDAANVVGTTPENISTIVKVADLLLLNETHTAAQAYDFFTDIERVSKEAQLLGGATYGDLVGYITQKYVVLPPKVRAAIILLEDFNNIDMSLSAPRLLSDYDWWMIDRVLAEQRIAIMPFI